MPMGQLSCETGIHMSSLFGPIRQNGIIVSSLDEALEYWTQTLRIGPFFRMDHVAMESFRYRGELSTPDVSIALANSGDMQIELIEQHNDASSPYLDFLNEHGPGLQHVSVWSENFDTDMQRFADDGATLLAEGVMADSGTRFSYFEGGNDGQPVMEVADLTPDLKQIFAMIRDEASGWDGSDPVR